jgi:hypothetical protein
VGALLRAIDGFEGHAVTRYALKLAPLALQLPFLKISESMGNHDSKIVGAGCVG